MARSKVRPLILLEECLCVMFCYNVALKVLHDVTKYNWRRQEFFAFYLASNCVSDRNVGVPRGGKILVRDHFLS